MIAITAVNDRYHPSAGVSFENLPGYHGLQLFIKMSRREVGEAGCKKLSPGRVLTQPSNRRIEVPDVLATYRKGGRNYIGKKIIQLCYITWWHL